MTKEEYVMLFKGLHAEILIEKYSVEIPTDFCAEELVSKLIELGILVERHSSQVS